MPMQKNHQLPCTDKHCRTASMQSVVVMDHHMMDMMVITARVEAATGMEAATRMEASPSSPTATCQFQKGLTGSCTKVSMLACTTAAQMLVAAAPGQSSAKVHVLSWQWCCSDKKWTILELQQGHKPCTKHWPSLVRTSHFASW